MRVWLSRMIDKHGEFTVGFTVAGAIGLLVTVLVVLIRLFS